MKNLIKLFFIVLCFFITLGANAAGIEYNTLGFQSGSITNTISIPDEEIGVQPDENETFFVSSNTQSAELYSQNERKDSFLGGALDKTSAQNKLLQQIFTSKYNKAYHSTSHKISSYLKNEICTRAP